MGYGAGYEYSHEFEGHVNAQDYLPGALAGMKLYRPTDQGIEARISERLKQVAALKARLKSSAAGGPAGGGSAPGTAAGGQAEVPPGDPQ